MKKYRKMWRQGDVLVMESEDRPPGDWKKEKRDGKGRIVLAAGEATGHHHAIRSRNVCLLRSEGISDAVLTVGRELAELVHEEHATINIPKGEHIVRRQVEWRGALSQRVED